MFDGLESRDLCPVVAESLAKNPLKSVKYIDNTMRVLSS